MRRKIRELEATLGSSQAQGSPSAQSPGNDTSLESSIPVPVVLEDAGDADYVSEMADALGSLSIGELGQARYHGQSAGAHVRPSRSGYKRIIDRLAVFISTAAGQSNFKQPILQVPEL